MTTPNPYRKSDPSKPIAPFTHITSNLKSRVDVDLAPLTFICGPNRSYKSALRQSVRLAAQRELRVDNKRTPLRAPSHLLKFAVDKSRGIAIALQSASGSLTFRLPINEETRKAKEPEPRGVTNELSSLTEEDWANAFPMDAVRQMLFMDARQARQAIVRIFGQGVTVSPPLGLSDLQKEMWNDGLATLTSDLDPVSALAALAAWAKDQKPRKTRAANSKEDSLAPLKARALLSGVETLPELESQLTKARAWESLAQTRAARDRAKSEVESLSKELKTLQGSAKVAQTAHREQERILEDNLIQARDRARSSRAKVADLERRILYGTNLLADLTARISAGKEECPFNHPLSREHLVKDQVRIEGTVKKRRSEFELAALDLDQIDSTVSAAEKVLTEFRRNSQHELTGVETQIARLDVRIDMHSRLLKDAEEALMGAPDSYGGATAASLETRVQDLRGAAEARQRYEDGMRDVRRLHDESAACKVVETEAHEIMQRVLVECKETAEACINEFMPPQFYAELNLEDDGCEFRVIGSDGEYHDSSASGSEVGSLIVALASALPGKLKILDMDDQDLHPFDPENIIGLWSAIEKAVASGALTQAIIVHNRPDEAPRRDHGWLLLKQVKVTPFFAENANATVESAPAPAPIARAQKIAPNDTDLINSI